MTKFTYLLSTCHLSPTKEQLVTIRFWLDHFITHERSALVLQEPNFTALHEPLTTRSIPAHLIPKPRTNLPQVLLDTDLVLFLLPDPDELPKVPHVRETAWYLQQQCLIADVTHLGIYPAGGCLASNNPYELPRPRGTPSPAKQQQAKWDSLLTERLDGLS